MKNVRKNLAFLTAVVMLFFVAGCGQATQENPKPNSQTTQENPKPTSQTTQESTEPVSSGETTGVSFPLKEEVTFDLMVKYDGDANELAKNVPFFQELYKATNVKINFISLPSDTVMNNINALFTAHKEGDAIVDNIISESDLMSMVENGLIIPLDEYIDNAEIMPNFNERVLGESPKSKGYITAADGHIYSLPRYNANNGDYLESPMWINKVWLDKVGLGVPTTIKELEAALIAFRDNDVNGNGNPDDEIPLLFLQGHAFSHMESLLGMWGLATKDNANDHFFDIDDGKAIFVPTTEAYKDAIKTLNSWWSQGLIWSEAFNGSGESFSAVTLNDGVTPLVGVYTTKNVNSEYLDQYVQVAPISAEGYEAEWFLHPGRLATKSKFCVTRSCENPEILMAWIDRFYDFGNSVRVFYGEEGLGWKYTEDGKVLAIVYTDAKKNQEIYDSLLTRCYGDGPGAFTEEDYRERLALTDIAAVKNESYKIYKDFIDDEFWPRPYMQAKDATRLAELRTDISNTVSMYKGNWVMGASDIDKDWDAYIKSLEKMGIGEYTEIIQRAYDEFVKNSK